MAIETQVVAAKKPARKRAAAKKISKPVAGEAVIINREEVLPLTIKDIAVKGDFSTRIYKIKASADLRAMTCVLEPRLTPTLQSAAYGYYYVYEVVRGRKGEDSGSWIAVPDGLRSFRATQVVEDVTDTFAPQEVENILTSVAHHALWTMPGPTTCGSDPEIFAVNKDGSLVPAFEFLDSKEDAPNSVNAGSAYWDGYQAEFAPAASHCLGWISDHHQSLMSGIRARLVANFPEAELTLRNTFNVPMERLLADDDKYVMFGCTPSMNAYGEPPAVSGGINPRDVPFRSAGGHLHFSLDESQKENVVEVVKALDSVLGVMCVSMFQFYDSPERRLLYGRAGEYRTPSHGLEYRVLSNAWLCHPAVLNFVFEVARKVIGNFRNVRKVWQASEDDVRSCINNCDVMLAHAILRDNSGVFTGLLQKLPTRSNINMWEDIVLNGVDKYLNNPLKPSANWALSGYWTPHCDGPLCNVSRASAAGRLEKGAKACAPTLSTTTRPEAAGVADFVV